MSRSVECRELFARRRCLPPWLCVHFDIFLVFGISKRNGAGIEMPAPVALLDGWSALFADLAALAGAVLAVTGVLLLATDDTGGGATNILEVGDAEFLDRFHGVSLSDARRLAELPTPCGEHDGSDEQFCVRSRTRPRNGVGVDLRPEALAELTKEGWARTVPRRRERVWLSAPSVSLGLLVMAVALSLVIPSPERVSGRGVLRAPSTIYLRSEVAGGIRAVAISPGLEVHEGQPLVELDNPETEGELRRARHRYDEALAAMLRDPRNDALGSEVGSARVALSDLRDLLSALTLRSPVDGRVLSVRAREGGLVDASDIVATIARDSEGSPPQPYLVATFPDATLGVIEEGTELELTVERSGDHRYIFVVRSVSREAISIDNPLQRHELALPESSDSVLVVEAELAEGAETTHGVLFDGMGGRVRALVRKRSIFERIVEAMGWRSRP